MPAVMEWSVVLNAKEHLLGSCRPSFIRIFNVGLLYSIRPGTREQRRETFSLRAYIVLFTCDLWSSPAYPQINPASQIFEALRKMVVAAAEPSAQVVAKKKTRRKMKKTPRTADPNEPIEKDEEMANEDGPSGSGSQEISPQQEEDDELMIDTEPTEIPSTSGIPVFPPMSAAAQASAAGKKSETRRIPIPPHRMTPLKKDWINVFGPLTELLGLQVRMNVQRKCVEIRVRPFLKCFVCEGGLGLIRYTRNLSDLKTDERNRRTTEGCRFRESICAGFRRERTYNHVIS